MADRRRQKNISSSVDHYYCKACKVYIADNKSQRLQHEMGAKHKAAAAAQIADIAKRNKEAAAKAKQEQAERERAEIIANGGRRAVLARSQPRHAEARSELLSRVAAAVVGEMTQLPVVPPDKGDGNEDVVADDSRERTGYGKWEEVLDVEDATAENQTTDNASAKGLKRKVRAEATIGAVDAGDEEEVLARREHCSAQNAVDDAEAGAVAFKPRPSKGKAKRRRRD